MHHPFRDEKKAKEYLDKGLAKAPDSSYGNHAMAQYFERIKGVMNDVWKINNSSDAPSFKITCCFCIRNLKKL